MKPSQLESYFARMGMAVPKEPTLDALKQIQEEHIYAIPVENLDIIRGKLPLTLEIDDLVDKVVNRRRGGLSFELNLLLSDALRDVGYEVKLMSAKHPKYGHEFDHAFLLVEVPGDAGQWIVDVGYTESFRTPLLFDCRIWQGDGRDEYRFATSADGTAYDLLRRRKGVIETVYSFNLTEHRPEEYRKQCDWFCTNEASRFTQGPFVFIERPEGRICYSMDTVMNTYTGEPIRPVVQNKEAENAVLREIFGIEADETLVGAASGGEKFAFKRVFAAIDEDSRLAAVVEKAVSVALGEKAHLRFGHIVDETKRAGGDREQSFPAYVQVVRERLSAAVEKQLADLGAADEVLGGEVVVMGSNSKIGATIDAPANYAPHQLVESLIKPFNPDIVICGASGKSKLRSFVQGSAEDHLKRELDCQVISVK